MAFLAVLLYDNFRVNLDDGSNLAIADQPFRRHEPDDQFDTSNAIVPADQIRSGGPGVDGIPAITDPNLLAAGKATFLRPTDQVIGVVFNDEARAYPVRALDYHEVVNDRIGDIPFAVTYCPLCDSSAVFDRRHEDGVFEFGVSGRLYNSNVLMYDRPSSPKSTLWSQVRSGAISGPRVNESLRALPVEVVAWEDWKTRHPDTKVLSLAQLRTQSLNVSPYEIYFRSQDLMFPVEPLDDRLPKKTPVIGVWGPSTARAYPLTEFADVEEQATLEQEVDGKKFSLVYDPQWKSLRITNADDGLQWLYSYWFAWASLREGSEIFVRR